MISVTEWIHVVDADAAFACPAANICLETGNSLATGTGCYCHHTTSLSLREDELMTAASDHAYSTSSVNLVS